MSGIKKFLSIFLAAIIIMSMVPLGAFDFTANAATEESGTYNDTIVNVDNITDDVITPAINADDVDNTQIYAGTQTYSYTSLSVNSSYNPYVSGYKYYSFTPSTSGYYVIYSEATKDTVVYLYDSNGNEIGYDDDSAGYPNFRLVSYLYSGREYTYEVAFYSTSNSGYIPFNFGRVYTVSYNANGGSGAPDSQNKYYGQNLTLSSSRPTRNGYTFLGWSTYSTATSATYSAGGTYNTDANVTLYAVWKPEYPSLTVNSSSSTYISTSNEIDYYSFTPTTSGSYVIYSTGSGDPRVYLYDSNFNSISANDDSNGLNFRLQYYLTAGQTYIYGIRFYGSSTGTINYKFGRVYTVSYDANGGSGAPSAQSKDYGKSVTLSSTKPTKSGCTFLGWSTSSAATTVSYQPSYSYSTEADLTLYAVWSSASYTVSYNANGGSGAPSSQTKYHNTSLTLSSAIPTRTGYDFLGWSTSSSATSPMYYAGGTYTSNASVTLYAVWCVKTYTVSYNANGGSGAPSSQTKTHGISLVLSSTCPTRTGYTFLGWSTSSTATTASYQPGSYFSTNANTTLYAVWQLYELTVDRSYSANITTTGQKKSYYFTPSTSGNYVIYSTSTSDTYVSLYNSSGSRLSYDDDDGDNYNFRLLYYLEAGKRYRYDVYYYSSSSTGSIPFTFGRTYTVTYNGNGGTGVPSSNTVDYGRNITMSSTVPTRTGYDFLGWSTSSSATSPTYYAGNTFTVSGNVTFYAVWRAKTYTISYNANGGSGAPSSQTKTHNVTLTLSNTRPTRTGFNFLGWSTSSTATTPTYYAGSTYSNNASVTLYAVWESTYPILTVDSSNNTYISSGGQIDYFSFIPETSGTYVIYSTGSEDTYVTLYNSSMTAIVSSDDDGDGNNFRLSYNLTAGTQYFFGVRYYNSSRTGSIYFKFGKVYTVSYNANGGSSAPAAQSKDYGKSINLTTAVPTRTGYSFLGWSTSNVSTSPDYYSGDSYDLNGNVTLYAVWGAQRYTISYNANGGSGAPLSQTKYYGTSLTLSTTVPTRTGYTFLGWSTSSSAAWATYQPGSTYSSNSSVTLYAVWKTSLVANTSRNTTISSSGEVDYFAYTPTVSGKYVIYATSDTPDSMVYLYDANGTQLSYNDDGGGYRAFKMQVQLTAGTPYVFGIRCYSTNTGTVYFKFGNVFTINYDANGGTGAPSSQSKEYGKSITLSSTRPTRTGYNFLGWSTSSNATSASYQPGATYSSESNITLYAVWQEILTLQSISIYSFPNKTTYYIGDNFDSTGLRLLLTYNDGSTSVISSGYSISGFSSVSNGTKNVTVTYKGFSKNFTVTVVTPSIQLSSDSITFREGDIETISAETTPAGYTINWSVQNSNIASYSNGVLFANAIGNTTITASFVYNGISYSDTCYVIVQPAEVVSVEVNDLPDKTSYYIGDELDSDGLVLKLIYSNNVQEYVSSGFTISGFNSETAGTKNVTVNYNGFSDTFNVTVATPTITLSSNNITLFNGDAETLTVTTLPEDVNVIWSSDDTNIATVYDGIISTKSAGTTTITAEFTYNGITYSDCCAVTVNAVYVTGISILTEPNNIEYFVGDVIDTTGISVEVSYNNGNKNIITSGFDSVSFDSSSAGEKEVTITYSGFSDEFFVMVYAPTISVSLDAVSLFENESVLINATTYPAFQEISWSSSDNTIATVTNGNIVAHSAGIATITAQFVYNEIVYFAECEVTVVAIAVVDVSIKTLPDKKVYYTGDVIETAGLSLELFYNDDTTEVITTGFSVSALDTSSVGSKDITVSYNGFSDSFTVVVKNPSIILSENNLVLYGNGDRFTFEATTDPEISRITWTSSDVSVATVSRGTVRSKALGTTIIEAKFDYNGKTYSDSCEVTVVDVNLDEVTINRIPSKTAYYIGDELDLSGLSLKLSYNDGSSRIIESDFTVGGFDSEETGLKTITISYNGFINTFNVTVKSPIISLSSTSETLNINDTFKIKCTTLPSSRTITWHSSDESVASVSNGTITANSAGNAIISAQFEYNDTVYSENCNVTVLPDPEPEPEPEPEITVKNVSINSNPNKTEYYVGESLDTTGLSINVAYSNDTTEIVSSGFTVSGYDSSVIGSQTLIVEYQGSQTSFEVNVFDSWELKVQQTGIFDVIPSVGISGFDHNDLLVFDKQGYEVLYNNNKKGWPLVKDFEYTIKLNISVNNGSDIVWRTTKKADLIFPDMKVSAWYVNAVTYAVGRGVISGYANGKFGTSDSIQRQDFLVMLARLDGVDLDSYARKSSFADVARNSYYEAAVNWGEENGIVTGYQNGKFGVGDKVTREQLVTFLYRYAKYKGVDTSYSNNTKNNVPKQYKDFKNTSAFAKDPILWAIENGVISGKNGNNVAPQGNAQRCEVAQIMYNIYINNVL